MSMSSSQSELLRQFVSRKAQIKMSKKMSSALRHRAEKMNLSISADGFILVTELLQHSHFREYTLAQLKECVATCEKQRFQLKQDSKGDLFIRATQGHSISNVKDDELLEAIVDPSSVPVCQHGTYAVHIPSILKTGLKRMQRNHVHLIACLPGDQDSVVSGMRKSADTIVTINVAAAMAAGIPFYRSSNGVILSPGLGDTGCIPAEFIGEVLGRGVATASVSASVSQPKPQSPIVI
jgi:RNA:NAD 2'-phosphotransferase (TPT1/KptA family)